MYIKRLIVPVAKSLQVANVCTSLTFTNKPCPAKSSVYSLFTQIYCACYAVKQLQVCVYFIGVCQYDTACPIKITQLWHQRTSNCSRDTQEKQPQREPNTEEP